MSLYSNVQVNIMKTT